MLGQNLNRPKVWPFFNMLAVFNRKFMFSYLWLDLRSLIDNIVFNIRFYLMEFIQDIRLQLDVMVKNYLCIVFFYFFLNELDKVPELRGTVSRGNVFLIQWSNFDRAKLVACMHPVMLLYLTTRDD